MKSTIFILLIALISVVISCEKETHENPYKGLLKRKSFYRSNQDSIPLSISDYYYDSEKRLKKTQDILYTELFDYNQNDELIRKFTYHIDVSGTTLFDTTFYQYQEGKLVYEESINLPPISYPYSFQTKYEYENSKLVRKKNYRDHQFYGMTTYEYSNNILSKEIHFSDSIGTRSQSYRKYLYDENKLSMAALVQYDGGSNQGLTLQVVYYFYDGDGHLIMEYAEQTAEVNAPLAYLIRYEYYEN